MLDCPERFVIWYCCSCFGNSLKRKWYCACLLTESGKCRACIFFEFYREPFYKVVHTTSYLGWKAIYMWTMAWMSKTGIVKFCRVLCFKFWNKFGDFREIILGITPGSSRQPVLYKYNIIANQILYQREHHPSNVCSSCMICPALPIEVVGYLFGVFVCLFVFI